MSDNFFRGRGRGAGGGERGHRGDDRGGRGGRGRGWGGRGDDSAGSDRGGFFPARGGGRGGRGGEHAHGGEPSRGGGYRGRGGGREFDSSMRGGRGQGRGGYGGGRGGGGFKPREPPRPFAYQGEAPPHPDQGIAKLENELMAKATPKATPKVAPKAASKGHKGHKGQKKPVAAESTGQQADTFRFPRRPAYGRDGRAIEVWANYFELSIAQMPCVYLYTFHVHKGRPPPADSSSASTSSPPSTEIKGPFLRKLLRFVLETTLNIPGLAPRTELQSKLITRQKIPQATIELLRDTQYEGGHFEVELDGPHTLDLDGLRTWLRTMSDERDAQDQSFPKFQDLLDAIGIIMGHGPRMGGANRDGTNPRVVAVGRSRFFPVDETREAELLPRWRPLEILRGYFQSVRPATGRLLLNVNVTHSVFRSSRERHFAELFRDCHYRDLEQTLKGARVRITYPDQSTKEFSVSGFAVKPGAGPSMGEARFRKISEISFSLDRPGPGQKKRGGKKGTAPLPAAGKQVTVREYLQEKFNPGSLPDTIAVNVGKSQSNPVYYPATWCTLLPGQPWNRKLSGDDTSSMIRFACRPPNLNADSIVCVGRQALMLDSADASFEDYNIAVGKKLITVDARVLPAPDLLYGRNFKMTPERGSWNLASRELIQGGANNTNNVKWAYFEMPGARGEVPAAVGAFKASLKQLRVPVSDTPVCLGRADDRRQFDTGTLDSKDAAVDAAFQRAMQSPPKPRIILFVLADNDKYVYERIKLQGDTRFGIHTVCVVSQKFTKNDKQYYANVALKFNLKLGGANHRLDRADRLGIIAEGKTMVVGYDVIHPTNLGTHDVQSLPSHVGLVASIGKDLVQWPACQWSQTGRQELTSDELTGAFQSRLARWREHNGAYPENILVYRDGVSEGQFAQVLDTELPQMKAALQRCGMERAKMAIVVSVKRHNTRFFPTTAQEMSRSGNIACGTVVDRGITLQRYWDFFLTAHTAIQGTARPARYTVIYDEIFQGRGSSPDAVAGELEKITYNMCYLFSRATKSVSICPPAYYADLVCTRARLYQSRLFNQVIDGGDVDPADQVFPEVHPDVRRDMYYI